MATVAQPRNSASEIPECKAMCSGTNATNHWNMQVVGTRTKTCKSLHMKTENKHHQRNLWNPVINAINILTDMIRSVGSTHDILSVISLSGGGCHSYNTNNTLLLKNMTTSLTNTDSNWYLVSQISSHWTSYLAHQCEIGIQDINWKNSQTNWWCLRKKKSKPWIGSEIETSSKLNGQPTI